MSTKEQAHGNVAKTNSYRPPERMFQTWACTLYSAYSLHKVENKGMPVVLQCPGKMLQLHGTLLGQQPLHLLVGMADKSLLLNVLFCYGVELLCVIFKVYPFTVCPHHDLLPHHTITQGTTMLAGFSDHAV